jgi:hypothetical protein
MNEIFSQYIYCFLHPWQAQETLRNLRLFNRDVERVSPLELVESRQEKKLNEDSGITWNESLLISWFFSILQLFYVLLGMLLGLEVFSSYSAEDTLLSPFLLDANFKKILYLMLFQGVLFPVSFWISSTFWSLLIKSFARLFEKDEENMQNVTEGIVATSLTSHAFLIIPVLGQFLFKVTTLIYIFAGLRRNLNLSVLQSFLVILCPLLLVLLMAFMLILMLIMAFAGF